MLKKMEQRFFIITQLSRVGCIGKLDIGSLYWRWRVGRESEILSPHHPKNKVAWGWWIKDSLCGWWECEFCPSFISREVRCLRSPSLKISLYTEFKSTACRFRAFYHLYLEVFSVKYSIFICLKATLSSFSTLKLQFQNNFLLFTDWHYVPGWPGIGL